MANGSRWNEGGALSLARYSGLEFQRCYLDIHGFLKKEALVREGLARLQQATNGMDRTRFRDYLAQEEQRFGFARDLGVIAKGDSLLKASKFWGYLQRGEPMIDLGAGDAGGHGVLTHRVQWALVGQWNERSGALRTPPGTLYRNLAAGNARVLSDWGRQQLAAGTKIDTDKGRFFDSVWDDVFDSEEWNATSPEQLFGYARLHYPGLRNRMEWPG